MQKIGSINKLKIKLWNLNEPTLKRPPAPNLLQTIVFQTTYYITRFSFLC